MSAQRGFSFLLFVSAHTPINPTGENSSWSLEAMALSRCGRDTLRRAISASAAARCDCITNLVLFAGHGLRYRKLEVILTTVLTGPHCVRSLLISFLVYSTLTTPFHDEQFVNEMGRRLINWEMSAHQLNGEVTSALVTVED
jgi:hypothetical protein